MRQSRWDWDNHADDDQGPVHSLKECRAICESMPECVQYSISDELRCMVTSTPNAGEWSRGHDSGWINERMEKFYNDQQRCRGEGWIT